ncbi:hypothetical protein HIM_05710 [Hirsutella minnesotensis 3608]|uniref:Uncharacterized protein n=1 Tax=Hirsutella minnesotensis 3608 TaxID=1043627 RepID=A0A0F8A5A3_9HYPO|nr:hypothetical protein HIM_05710 [Hirsutella minnesotensis 3608]
MDWYSIITTEGVPGVQRIDWSIPKGLFDDIPTVNPLRDIVLDHIVSNGDAGAGPVGVFAPSLFSAAVVISEAITDDIVNIVRANVARIKQSFARDRAAWRAREQKPARQSQPRAKKAKKA